MISKCYKIIATIFVFFLSSCSTISYSGCSDNWKVTGFYTPVESDYKGSETTLHVRGQGLIRLKKSFIRTVKIEGWGKTRYGWYLGYYSNAWHSSNSSMNARGAPLRVGMAAVDPDTISLGRQFSIPELTGHFDTKYLTASDVGSAVKRKHIDVYTGEGHSAKKLTYSVTGNKTVCF